MLFSEEDILDQLASHKEHYGMSDEEAEIVAKEIDSATTDDNMLSSDFLEAYWNEIDALIERQLKKRKESKQ